MFCISRTTKGTPCSRKAVNGDYCAQHNKIYSKPTKIIEYIIPNITDDITLNHIISKLDIVSLTNLSQVSHISQILCGNNAFWTTKFNELPFFYKIPKTTATIIKEYRRIYEANILTERFFDLRDSCDLPLVCGINGKSTEDRKEWFKLNLVWRTSNIIDMEHLGGVRYITFAAHGKESCFIRCCVNKMATQIKLSTDLKDCRYTFSQAIYHIKFPKFIVVNTENITEKSRSEFISYLGTK